jgi:hypothetical protein
MNTHDVALPLAPNPVHLAVPKLPPEIYENAQFEQITCTGLNPKYDGSPDNLIPMPNLIHLCRQNMVRSDATYFTHEGKTLDLVHKFQI